MTASGGRSLSSSAIAQPVRKARTASARTYTHQTTYLINAGADDDNAESVGGFWRAAAAALNVVSCRDMRCVFAGGVFTIFAVLLNRSVRSVIVRSLECVTHELQPQHARN